MKKNIYLVIFITLIVSQLTVVSLMVYKGNKKGGLFYFKCKLYDPYSPIKGRYLALSFDIENCSTILFNDYNLDLSPDIKNYKGKDVYISFYSEKETQTPYQIAIDKPVDTKPFVKAKIKDINKDENIINLDLSFKKYYIQEDFAKDAELILRDVNRDKELNPTIVVSVDKNGDSKIVNLLVKNIPIEEYITKNNKKYKKR